MKTKDRLKYMGRNETFKIRDAVKTLLIYFDLSLLRKLQKEITERLEELKGDD